MSLADSGGLSQHRVELRPDDLADRAAGHGAPAGGEFGDEEQAVAGLRVDGRRLKHGRRMLFVTGVGDLDAERRARDADLQFEVATKP